MHAEPGACVYFHDSATDFGERLCDIRRDDVDPGNIETDDPRSAPRDPFIFVMQVAGAIDRGAAGGHIRGRAKVKDFAWRQDGFDL